MLKFTALTRDSFNHYASEILRAEEQFPKPLRESAEDIQSALSRDRAFGLIALESARFIGNISGYCPNEDDLAELGLNMHRAVADSFLYLNNIVILPEYTGKGYGRALLSEFCREARKRDVSLIGGHFRKNASLSNFIKAGGKQRYLCPDWFGSGESYCYCELQL